MEPRADQHTATPSSGGRGSSCPPARSSTWGTWWSTPAPAGSSRCSDRGGESALETESGHQNFLPAVRLGTGNVYYKHLDTLHLTRLYMDLQCVGSSSSLSSRGISFSPTMLSITRSRGPPPFTWPLLSLRLLGAETTASRADRCFLQW